MDVMMEITLMAMAEVLSEKLKLAGPAQETMKLHHLHVWKLEVMESDSLLLEMMKIQTMVMAVAVYAQ